MSCGIERIDFRHEMWHTGLPGLKGIQVYGNFSESCCPSSGNGVENLSDSYTHSTYGVLWKLDMRQVGNLTFHNIGQTGLLSQPLTFSTPLSSTILPVMNRSGIMLKRMPKKPKCD
ncbi:hypothetical protein L1987_65086 [Smallanthus sonchifolius]|uniref:Uncharacterized protein n=1 Tax=Smallanthus sonchifolius TaxID=185202 RepID=A0ACB9BTI8_9ASTR|nr:hypothetical protein L1987_65086 [Smallanthus sonchifolius]